MADLVFEPSESTEDIPASKRESWSVWHEWYDKVIDHVVKVANTPKPSVAFKVGATGKRGIASNHGTELRKEAARRKGLKPDDPKHLTGDFEVLVRGDGTGTGRGVLWARYYPKGKPTAK